MSQVPGNGVEGHIVACAVPLWGHTKGLCALVAKLARLRNNYVTLFTGVSLVNKVLNEVEKQFLSEDEEHIKKHVRVIPLAESASSFDFKPFMVSFVDAYKNLQERRPIAESPASSKFHDVIRSPQLVILQFFMYEAMLGIRSITGSAVPVYVWQPASAAGIMFRFGPEIYGGMGDLSEKIKSITADDEVTFNEETEKIYNRSKKELINIPGIPAMYDYEFSPQKIKRSVSASLYAQFVYRMFEESDGVILYTNATFEGPALELWQRWFGTRPVLAVGPIPPLLELTRAEREGDPHTLDETQSFLDKTLAQFGPNSAVYISFGTVWWPAEPEKVWVFLDVLMEMNIPFLFSHASPSADIPDEVKRKVSASGLGYMAKWFPQPPPSILRHKACGWFVTHCGHNSIMEALLEGVPLICWPFLADQPSNAANITYTHNAGYELFEVRSGYGLWPIHRLNGWAPSGTLDAFRRETREVLTKARGEDGERKRRNAQELGRKYKRYWVDGEGAGGAWDELKKILPQGESDGLSSRL